MNNRHFILFSNCIPVKGFKSSIIMDLQREKYLEIPNLLYYILNQDLKRISIKKLKSLYENEYDEGIDKYFNYLEEIEYGFYTNEPNLFPDLNIEFSTPFKILSSVICINENSNFSLSNILNQIKKLGVQTLQIRCFNKLNIITFLEDLKILKNSRIKIVELFIRDFDYKNEDILLIANSDSRIIVFVHSTLKKQFFSENKNIEILNYEISENDLEVYSPKTFVINIPFFCESNSFNVGLNKKVSIDFDGTIKNYVNHKIGYGNINDVLIESVIEKKCFQEKWNINNDKIEKCLDCQFRYACLSNSDIFKDENGKFHKFHKCNFNPYINSWI